MFTMVKIAAIAASVVGLVGGTTGTAPTPAHPQRSIPVNAATVDHWRGPTVAAELEKMSGMLADPNDPPPPMFTHSCARINSDGVRIHSTYSSSAPVVGLAYNGDLYKIAMYPLGGWSEGTDLRNGVHGWVDSQFVDLYMVNC